MHIVYASDEGYARHAAASMLSVIDHNPAKELHFHLLSTGIGEKAAKQLHTLVESRGAVLDIHEMGDLNRWFDFSVNPRGFAITTLARLFLARVLPESIDRVLYLDCDTVVLGDLRPLLTLDMDGCVLGMVMEPTATKARRVQLKLPDAQPYFNAGVLLIDLKRWRDENTEQTVLSFYRDMGGDLVAPDQDAINGALVGHIKQIPPCYNFGTVQLYYPYKAQVKIASPTPMMPEADYRAAVAHPVIIHYLGEERPWRAGNRHPYREKYEHYLSQTPWADTPKDEGWRLYYHAYYLFSAVMRIAPVLRWRIIDRLIPVFMHRRERQLKDAKARKS